MSWSNLDFFHNSSDIYIFIPTRFIKFYFSFFFTTIPIEYLCVSYRRIVDMYRSNVIKYVINGIYVTKLQNLNISLTEYDHV